MAEPGADEDDEALSYGGFGCIMDLTARGPRNPHRRPLGFDLMPFGVDHHPDKKPTRRAPRASHKRRKK